MADDRDRSGGFIAVGGLAATGAFLLRLSTIKLRPGKGGSPDRTGMALPMTRDMVHGHRSSSYIVARPSIAFLPRGLREYRWLLSS